MIDQDRLLIMMVGLPCTGKSFLSQRILDGFRLEGVLARIFNIGNKRRDSQQGPNKSDFFKDFNNSKDQREKLAEQTLQEAIDFLLQSSQKSVAIFDGTNTTKQRRKFVTNKVSSNSIQILWIESIGKDQKLIDQFIRDKKIHNEDYKDSKMSLDERFADFKK